MKLSIVNRKGGVGKTTSIINIGAAFANAERLGFAERNLRVLLVDMDSQANTTTGLGLSKDAEGSASIADVILGSAPITSAIKKTGTPNLHILPGSDRIAQEEPRLYKHYDQAIYRLRQAIAPLEQVYDIVLYDCPPALGMVFTMTMLASDFFLVPITPRQFDIDGLANLFHSYVDHRKQFKGETADLLGIVITMYNGGINQHAPNEAVVRDLYHEAVFQSKVRVNEPVSRAQMSRQTVFQHAPNSNGAADYRNVAAEILKRARQQGHLTTVREAA